MDIITIRNKGKEILKKILNNEKNIIVFEKNIYEITNKNLKIQEDLETNYFINIYNVINIIKNKNEKLQYILESIKKGDLYWNNKFYENIHFKEQEQDNFLIKPFEIEEGVLECKCGSKRVLSYQKQTRGGDESSTTFANCMECGKKWTYSG
jgi:DNA-directed RNA polymerase subunit M/transcription elongation factor TFIIS